MNVDLDGVSKRYGETAALADVSLSVADGEFFTLLGPSGCGKTTTLRLLAGFEAPTEGSIRFDGTDVAGRPPEARGVGLVFQSYALFPHMSVGENVAYGLRFAEPPGGGSTDDRVAELLELVGLEGFAERDPASLSGGQQQRVALARALAPGPDLLLLDEPMSALDARLRERLRRDVREIQRELDVTTVYVTHDQAEALAISDRVAVLSDGRLQQVGTPEALYRRPESRFVAEFLGENNVFEGRVTGAADDDGTDVDERDDDDGTTDAGTADDLATVRVDDAEFRVPAPDGPPGSSVTVSVRPAAFDVDADENRLTGTVTDSEFRGETTRVHLEWGGRRVAVSLTDPPETDELTVGFDPADAWVLP